MKNIRVFYLKIFSFFGVKFSLYLNRRVFVMLKISLSKQCRPRSDTAECGIRSESTLFAIYSVILHTFIGNKMDLLRRSIR